MTKNISEKIDEVNEGLQCKHDCDTCAKRGTVYALMNYVGLSIFKAVVGVLTGSKALVADAIHSGADAATAIVGTIGLKVAKRPKDETHPYGYGKIEFVIGLFVGLGLLFAACEIMFSSGKVLFSGNPIKAPNPVSIVMPIIAIYANYVVSRLTSCVAKESKSPILKAVSMDIRADMFSSIPVVIALVGAQLGFPWLDPLGGVIVGAIIFKASFEILHENYMGLADSSADEETLNELGNIVGLVPDIKATKYIRTRRVGAKLWVDICILLGKEKTLDESRAITSAIKNSILYKMPDTVDEVQVYVNPL